MQKSQHQLFSWARFAECGSSHFLWDFQTDILLNNFSFTQLASGATFAHYLCLNVSWFIVSDYDFVRVMRCFNQVWLLYFESTHSSKTLSLLSRRLAPNRDEKLNKMKLMYRCEFWGSQCRLFSWYHSAVVVGKVTWQPCLSLLNYARARACVCVCVCVWTKHLDDRFRQSVENFLKGCIT